MAGMPSRSRNAETDAKMTRIKTPAPRADPEKIRSPGRSRDLVDAGPGWEPGMSFEAIVLSLSVGSNAVMLRRWSHCECRGWWSRAIPAPPPSNHLLNGRDDRFSLGTRVSRDRSISGIGLSRSLSLFANHVGHEGLD